MDKRDCKNHPGRQAIYVCLQCTSYFCGDCTNVKKFAEDFTAYICRECGGKCESLLAARKAGSAKTEKSKLFNRQAFGWPKREANQEKVSVRQAIKKVSSKISWPAEGNFWLDLAGLVFFPLRGWGIIITLLSAILFLGLSMLRALPYSIDVFVRIVYTVYFLIYLFKVMDDSRAGADRLRRFPDFNYWIESAKGVFYAVAAFLVCLGAANIYFVLGQRVDLIYLMLLGAGCFLLPIFLVKIVVTKKANSLNPLTAFVSIFKNMFVYVFFWVMAAGFLFLFYFLNNEWINSNLSDSQFLEKGATFFLMAYFLFVQVRLWGIFAKYYQNRIGAV